MSGQQIGTVVGGAIGAYFGGPAGAQLGMAIGGMVGGAVDPTHINGPKIGDGQQQSATDGNPIAWIQGTAMCAGTIVQASTRRQIRHKDNGKGGPVSVTYTAEQDFAILVCESSELRGSTMSAVLMVMQDGKIVYDVRAGSSMLTASYKWKANVDFMFGAESQMPHPTLEAITGVGNTPAYRGSLIAVFKNFDVSAAGDRIPSFQFVVASAATTVTPVGTLLATSTVGFYGDYRPNIGTFSDTLAPTMAPYLDFQATVAPSVGETRPPMRCIVKNVPGGAVAWDSGWLGETSHQAALNAACAASGYPELVGLITDTQDTGLIIKKIFSSPTSFTYTMYVGDYHSNVALTVNIKSVVPPPTSTPLEVSLQSIVSAVCKRGGLAASDIDVTGIAGTTVAGYPIARQANAADCLLPLMQAYFGYGTEYDAKLRFKFYGEDAAITVAPADLLENTSSDEGNVKSDLRNQETEFPRRIVASYMDPAQNYTVVQQAAERRSIDVKAIGDQAFQIPVVMNAATAAKAADRALKVAYATLQGTLGFSTPFAGSAGYITVAAGEAILFNGKRYVADEMVLGNGSIKFTPRYDRQSAYTSNVQAIEGNAPSTPASPYSGPTMLVPMNLPSQRPQDSVGIYVTAGGQDGQSNWRGCTVQVSYDSQASWVNALTISTEATLGTVALNEPTGGEPITVNSLKYPLESVTTAQLGVGANACASVDSLGNAQLWQFGTATETTTDLQFELTDTSRSLGGTAAYPVSAGDTFTLMDAAYFLPINQTFQGKTIYLRGVGFGENAEDAVIYSLVYLALVQAPGQQRVTEAGVNRVTEDGFNLRFTEG